MSGHESPEQQRDILARQAAVDPSTSPVDEVVDLALVLVEPAHREDDAIALLETALTREPAHLVARLWLAYLLLHVRMDRASVDRAAELVGALVGTELDGAAQLLLAEIADEQGAPLEDRVRLLEASVLREPSWVSNRHDLAWAYAEGGRHQDAAEQLRQGQSAVLQPDPSWSIRRSAFEETITARTSAGAFERLQADLDELGL